MPSCCRFQSMSNSKRPTIIPGWFELPFFPPCFFSSSPQHVPRTQQLTQRRAEQTPEAARSNGRALLQSHECSRGRASDTISSQPSPASAGSAQGHAQDASGCEKGPYGWAAQSPDRSSRVSPFSTDARLRAGSFLAGFFHVYSSYSTIFTKRELHK